MTTKKATGAVIDWAEEMKRKAKIASSLAESMSTGSWFSLKSGQLSYNGTPMPDNQVPVVILAAKLENTFYEVAYDPDSPASPSCFAIADATREAKDSMAPHAAVPEESRQCDTCAGCEKNKFGSAEKGKGKACANKMRLALIPAGAFVNGKFTPEKDPAHFTSAQIAKLRLPVMSVPEYNKFVKQVAGLELSPHGMVAAKLKVVPDAKSQFKVTFELLAWGGAQQIAIPSKFLATIGPRMEEGEASISDPGYQANEEREAPAPKRAAKTRAAAPKPAPAKPAAKAAPAAAPANAAAGKGKRY